MFAGSTFRQVIDPCFEQAGFTPKIMFEARTNHVIALMVSRGICLTILPESQAKLYPHLCWFRLEDNPTLGKLHDLPKNSLREKPDGTYRTGSKARKRTDCKEYAGLDTRQITI
mgnify:CR=1 FL=1